eukprot:jgi/Hompol1/4994/HPOL_001096-RA
MDDPIEQAKKLAAFRAIDEQVDSKATVIGIGSGSTVVYAVQRLGERFAAESLPIKACIPTSFQSENLIIEAVIDIAFDGADEVDPQLNCIKGGGACLLLEKLVASNAKRFYIIADSRKNSEALGTKFKQGVPIEVVPAAYVSVMRKLRELGGIPTLRMGVKKAGPVVTDNGNFVIDADFGSIADPVSLNEKLIKITGIVETGLFCAMANGAYFGLQNG